jgi:molecular chaperone HscB
MSDATATVPKKCLACDAQLTSPIVCQGCHSLYPVPKEVDYFDLLGLPRRYDIDLAELNERFVALSRHVHPDYFSQAAEPARQLSVRLSAELNDAVQLLRDPVLRADYLLETAGGQSAPQDRTVPTEVLSQTLLLREEIDDARTSHDPARLAELRQTVDLRRRELIERIGELAPRVPTASDEDKVQLRRTINSVKYFANLLDLLWTA